jgi:hypothetical protein
MKNSCKYEILDISSSTDLEVLIQDISLLQFKLSRLYTHRCDQLLFLILWLVYLSPVDNYDWWNSCTGCCGFLMSSLKSPITTMDWRLDDCDKLLWEIFSRRDFYSCKYEILDISSSTDLEVLIQDPIKMLLCVVYRHPNTKVSPTENLPQQLVTIVTCW